MAVTPEEQRLLDYQAQQREREANDKARRAALKGDPAAKRAFDSRWEPLTRWMAEHEPGGGDRPWS